MEKKIAQWFDAGLGELGFRTIHVDRVDRCRPGCAFKDHFFVEVKGTPKTPWFDSEVLHDLSHRLDAMVEMNGNEALGVEGILECPELHSMIPDPHEGIRMIFKVKYVPKISN